ncbi:MAG: 50S ribosomal protein L18 [Bacteroidetes bacterium RIFCSPLOWO2_12_FULL_37_12]|nr:MAG: 50S ribosomal protein L18 [Bacteroidetes bacterium RIFCSPLOWO2_12_FULL_37_12]
MKSKTILRRNRIRRKIKSIVRGNESRPRLSVFRSNKEIYAQLIDDSKGITLYSQSSIKQEFPEKTKKAEKAKLVGKLLAEKAISGGVKSVVFDRGGYQYHGRVKAVADGAREGGLVF